MKSFKHTITNIAAPLAYTQTMMKKNTKKQVAKNN